MRKHAIAVVAGIASAGLLSAQASASDFQTRFGHKSKIGAEDPLEAWVNLNSGRAESGVVETSVTEFASGIDVPVGETDEGQWRGGGYVLYSVYNAEGRDSCSNIASFSIEVNGVSFGGSDILRLLNLTCPTGGVLSATQESDQYGIAGTLAWIGNSGAYLDFQAGYSETDVAYSVNVTRGGGSANAETDFRTTALQAEMGQKFDVGSKFFVTPSVRLRYNSFDHDQLELPSSRYLRAGALVSYEPAEGRRVYGEINIARVDISSFEETFGEIGFGGNFPVGEDEKTNLSLKLSVADILDSFGDNLSLIGSVKLAIPF